MDLVASVGAYAALYVLGGLMGLGLGAWLAACARADLHAEVAALRRRLGERAKAEGG